MAIQYLFSINAGRSGSDYLTELLAQASNAVSLHEALPIMNGRPMQQFNQGDEGALRALMPFKLQEIRKKRKNDRKIYCETNHTFIKGWGYLIPEFIPQEQIGVIILRRPPEQIIRSHLRIRTVPGTTRWSKTWVLTPGAARDLGPPPETDDVYARCEWYVEEVERRAQAYQKHFPGITYAECDLDQLNDPGFVRQLFVHFGLTPSPQLDSVVGRRLNARSEWPPATLAELRAPPVYPLADDLSPAERDTLIAEMVAYLHTHKQRQIRRLSPDMAMGASLFAPATRIVSYVERELEEAFHVSLPFTETEMILTHEFLYSLAPRDLMLIPIQRQPPPGLAYHYNFNIVPTLGFILRHFGLSGLLRMAVLISRGLWGSDYSHRDYQP
jgi:hypothetical protein